MISLKETEAEARLEEQGPAAAPQGEIRKDHDLRDSPPGETAMVAESNVNTFF